MDSPEENTQSLRRRAHKLINPEFRNTDTDFPKENVSPRKRAFGNAQNAYRCDSVKDARKKIREEWNVLKNSTIIDPDRLTDPKNNQRTSNESNILYGAVVYIEVPNMKRITILKSKLEKLGATVKDDFTQEVTHVVYKNGSLETFKRAKLLNVHLVSVLWIQACENSKTKICEKLFPAYEKNEYINSPRVFRKFWTHEGKNFKYDESTGTILRKPRDACQSIVSPMKNLEINLNLTNSSNSENIDEVNQESDQSTTKDTTPGNSSTQSITLQLSSDKKNSSHEKSSTENDEVERNKSSNKLKTPVKRRLFVKNHKNASFIRFSNDENISTQEEQIVLPNPYNPTKPNENCTKSKSTNLSIKPIQTYVHIKQFPKSGFKNIQYRNKLPTLVTSYFHSDENKAVKEILKKLGGFNFKFRVDSTTTHVVVGECQRTPNILKGMARGCWILNKQWIFESANAGHWLSEEYFELTEFSKIVQRCRIQKQAFGKYFSFDVFDECGPIYISKNCNSRYEDLKELVVLSGGKLSEIVADAKIIVGIHIEDSSKKCVTAEWILDSITLGRCKTIGPKYILMSS